MFKMKFTYFLIFFFTLGCSTEPFKSVYEYREAGADNTFLFQAPSGKTPNVIITRDPGLVGGAGNLLFFVNGKKVLRLASGWKGSIYLTPGSYVFGAGSANSNEPTPSIEVETVVPESDVVVYRIWFTVENGPVMHLNKTNSIKY